jgi:hypothetical protein
MRKTILALGLALVLLLPQVAETGALSRSEDAIWRASQRWDVNYWWLRRVSVCESGLNPWAYNRWSGAAGLFQFLPSTYWSHAYSIGERSNYWNPYAAANVAAYMFRIGQSGQWACR